jgi:enoyl-CoA hydratase/carnithine racemase
MWQTASSLSTKRLDENVPTLLFFRIEHLGSVARCALDKPPANTLDDDLHDDFDRLLSALELDERVRAVVLASANPSIFMAGADLKNLAEDHFTPAAAARRVGRAHETFLRVQRLTKPTVAEICGHAVGGGCELALACDFRVMSQGEARIGCPEITLGIVPGGGGTQRLPRLVGRAKAAELLLLGERLTAGEAVSIGLVTRACAGPEETRSAALELAGRLAGLPASGLRLIKRCLNDGYDGDLLRGLAVEREAAIEALGQPEAREGITAFAVRQAARSRK